MGQSRRFDSAPLTSGLPRSADIADRKRKVRKVPKSGSEPARNHLYEMNDIVQSLLDEVFFLS